MGDNPRDSRSSGDGRTRSLNAVTLRRSSYNPPSQQRDFIHDNMFEPREWQPPVDMQWSAPPRRSNSQHFGEINARGPERGYPGDSLTGYNRGPSRPSSPPRAAPYPPPRDLIHQQRSKSWNKVKPKSPSRRVWPPEPQGPSGSNWRPGRPRDRIIETRRSSSEFQTEPQHYSMQQYNDWSHSGPPWDSEMQPLNEPPRGPYGPPEEPRAPYSAPFDRIPLPYASELPPPRSYSRPVTPSPHHYPSAPHDAYNERTPPPPRNNPFPPRGNSSFPGPLIGNRPRDGPKSYERPPGLLSGRPPPLSLSPSSSASKRRSSPPRELKDDPDGIEETDEFGRVLRREPISPPRRSSSYVYPDPPGMSEPPGPSRTFDRPRSSSSDFRGPSSSYPPSPSSIHFPPYHPMDAAPPPPPLPPISPSPAYHPSMPQSSFDEMRSASARRPSISIRDGSIPARGSISSGRNDALPREGRITRFSRGNETDDVFRRLTPPIPSARNVPLTDQTRPSESAAEHWLSRSPRKSLEGPSPPSGPRDSMPPWMTSPPAEQLLSYQLPHHQEPSINPSSSHHPFHPSPTAQRTRQDYTPAPDQRHGHDSGRSRDNSIVSNLSDSAAARSRDSVQGPPDGATEAREAREYATPYDTQDIPMDISSDSHDSKAESIPLDAFAPALKTDSGMGAPKKEVERLLSRNQEIAPSLVKMEPQKSRLGIERDYTKPRSIFSPRGIFSFDRNWYFKRPEFGVPGAYLQKETPLPRISELNSVLPGSAAAPPPESLLGLSIKSYPRESDEAVDAVLSWNNDLHRSNRSSPAAPYFPSGDDQSLKNTSSSNEAEVVMHSDGASSALPRLSSPTLLNNSYLDQQQAPASSGPSLLVGSNIRPLSSEGAYSVRRLGAPPRSIEEVIQGDLHALSPRYPRIEDNRLINESLSWNHHLVDAPQSRPETGDIALVQAFYGDPRRKQEEQIFEAVSPVLQAQLAADAAALEAKNQRLRDEYRAVNESWNHHRQRLDRLGAVRNRKQNMVSGEENMGRTTRRGAISLGDAARSDLELDQIMASLVNEDLTNPDILARRNLAIIPDMLSVTNPRALDCRYDDYNGLIMNAEAFADSVMQAGDWTPAEKDSFIKAYVATPKQFGRIAQHLPHKTSEQCVLFYYLHKKEINFKALTSKQGVRGRRGRRGGKQKANALLNDLRRPRIDDDEASAVDSAPDQSPYSDHDEFSSRSTFTNGPLRSSTRTRSSRLASADHRSESDDDDRQVRITSHSEDREQSVAGVDAQRKPRGPGRGGGKGSTTHWTSSDKATFLRLLPIHGKNWAVIAEDLPDKTPVQVRNYFQNHSVELGLPAIAARADKPPRGAGNPNKHVKLDQRGRDPVKVADEQPIPRLHPIPTPLPPGQLHPFPAESYGNPYSPSDGSGHPSAMAIDEPAQYGVLSEYQHLDRDIYTQ